MNPCDGRYEELKKGNITRNVIDDISAGLIVAAVSIPLAMGFAMASGLRPEQGIIGGAVAGLFGALFGGSKYQVYGPAAAFIPIIAGLTATYNHGFLVLASLIAGAMLLLSGFLKLGSIIKKTPHSIVIGFTVGIAIIIVFSQIGNMLGLKEKGGHHLVDQVGFILRNTSSINFAAITMTLMTIIFCRAFERISSVIPGIVPALFFGYFGGQTFWSQKGLIYIGDQYGSISLDAFTFTPPLLPEVWTLKIVYDLCYYAFAFFVIAGIESLLCGRAADRLAFNKGLPFDPNKELRGQGMINIFSPLFNGFPYTGTLGRTALNIRSKGRSPLAGFSKFVFKLLLAGFFSAYLEKIPMACVSGILFYVAIGMIKKREINSIVQLNNYHVVLMFYTMVTVPLLGFVAGILSALILFTICYRLFEKNKSTGKEGNETKIIKMGK